MSEPLDGRDGFDPSDWYAQDNLTDQWSGFDQADDQYQFGSFSDHHAFASEHQGPSPGYQTPTQPPHDLGVYGFDSRSDVPRQSIEQHVPSPACSAPLTIAPHALMQNAYGTAGGLPVSLSTSGSTVNPEATQDNRGQTFFSHTLPANQQSAMAQDRQAAHQASRSEPAPYFQHLAGSDLRSRWQFGTPGANRFNNSLWKHHADNSAARTNHRMNMPNSPAFFAGPGQAPPMQNALPANVVFHTTGPRQVCDGNLHPTYEGRYQMSASAPSDAHMSPTPGLSNARLSHAFSSPEPSECGEQDLPELKGSRLPPITHAQSIECHDCGKAFKKSVSPDRCGRCGLKDIRRKATPQAYQLDGAVPDAEAAKAVIYKPRLAKGPQMSKAELQEIRGREDEYIQRLLDAINHVVPGGEGGRHDDPSKPFLARQQIVYNQKATIESKYSSALVTARLRALLEESITFHAGAPTTFYPPGGDSHGYHEDTKLSFDERMGLMCRFLTTDKRIVMDVIEGRGVQGFVCNPTAYDKRKQSNNNCNKEKKKVMDKGKLVADEGGGGGAAAAAAARKDRPSRGGKRKRAPSPSPPHDDDAAEAGPAQDSGPDSAAHAVAYGSGRHVTMRWLRGRGPGTTARDSKVSRAPASDT